MAHPARQKAAQHAGDSALAAAALREQLLASGAAPKALPNRVAVTLSEPNVLLLDRAEFCMDGGAYQPAQELLRADNVLRSQLGFTARGGEVAQPWVLPEEKTEHFATLRFTVEVKWKYRYVWHWRKRSMHL
ncbi:MAG: hypothetical protein ACLU3U_04665 [Gallintestinimicrobium sp.]